MTARSLLWPLGIGLACGLGCAALLMAIGILGGPTVLWYDEVALYDWFGFGKLPEASWCSLGKHDQKVGGTGIPFNFIGGIICDPGDWFVAVGPEGVGIGRCAETGPNEGFVESRVVLHHAVVGLFLAVVGMAFGASVNGFRAVLSKFCRRLSQCTPEDRCITCGYSLRYLPTPRCPECGNVAAQSPSAGVRNVDRIRERSMDDA